MPLPTGERLLKKRRLGRTVFGHEGGPGRIEALALVDPLDNVFDLLVRWLSDLALALDGEVDDVVECAAEGAARFLDHSLLDGQVAAADLGPDAQPQLVLLGRLADGWLARPDEALLLLAHDVAGEDGLQHAVPLESLTGPSDEGVSPSESESPWFMPLV
ncbi:hypothetical protein HYQ46_007547 [Verticillium longisporum]|nr:hypothetical protein HYQ46_007547 [Verticillium longisporum]